MLNSAVNNKEWDEYWDDNLPTEIRDQIKTLYQDMVTNYEGDDIIEA